MTLSATFAILGNYEPLSSLPPAALAPALFDRRRGEPQLRAVTDSHGMRYGGYPLQFFTTYYTNQVNFKLTGRKADEGGLFSAIGGQVSLWRDLNSEGYEDQRS